MIKKTLVLFIVLSVAPFAVAASSIERKVAEFKLDPFEEASLVHTCGSGNVVSGGFSFGDDNFEIIGSYPANASSWRIDFRNFGTTTLSSEVTIHMICTQ